MNPLRFEPDLYCSTNYQLEPDTWLTRCALGVAARYGNWRKVAEAAALRHGYGNSDWGIGLEYPTRPDKAGFVRWWRWKFVEKKDSNGKKTGQHRIKTRKFYMSESTYLGVLVGVLRAHGWDTLAQTIESMMPVEKVEARFEPDIYSQANYQFAEYSREFDHGLHLLLSLRNLDRARTSVLKRKGFNSDTHSLRYQKGGKLQIAWVNGTKSELSEAVYLEVLEQVLSIHGLPSICQDDSEYPTVLYKPGVQICANYAITPRNKTNLAALEVILAWPRLEEAAQVALGEKGFRGSYLSKKGMGASIQGDEVVLTYRHAVKWGGWELRISKGEYLAVLAAVLRARGHDAYAEVIKQLMPVEPVQVEWKPDPFWSNNYRITPFDTRAEDCLDVIFHGSDFAKVMDDARNKRGFQEGYYTPIGLNWRNDGRVKLVLPNGNDRLIPEALYLSVLHQVLAIHGLEGLA